MNLFLSLVVSHWRQSNPDTVESDAVEAVAESLKTSSVVLSTRVYSALAGCVVRLDELPGKLNPVIKPIMDTLKREVRCVKCCNENLAGSDLVIMPYKVINIRFITLYGTTSGSLSANYLYARYSNIFLHRSNVLSLNC